MSQSHDGLVARGIWQMTPGAATDVEADEVFVVLSGRATVASADGTVLEVGPGDVAVLTEGAETTWTVHETLRKVYQVTSSPSVVCEPVRERTGSECSDGRTRTAGVGLVPGRPRLRASWLLDISRS